MSSSSLQIEPERANQNAIATPLSATTAAAPPRRAIVAGEEEEASRHCRQPRSQGRKEEGAETLILEREYSAPRVSV